ncbi:MAG TPA: glycosyltransferase [Gemmatimonadaceae bacterium]
MISPLATSATPEKQFGVSSRANVLHLIAPGEVGGAESVVRLLASRQRSLGARVGVAAIVQSESGAADLLKALEDAGVETHRVRVGGRDYRRERKAIAALCNETAPDIVHSHGYRADVVDSMHVRRDVPIVTTVHGFTGGDQRNRLYQWLQCLSYRRFDAVVAVSEPLRGQLARRIGSSHLHLLPNAYSPDEAILSRASARAALGVPNDDFLVGWVGRLSREKGPDVLLDALAHAEMPTGMRAIFLGDGPLSTTLRERAAHLGLGQRISWTGSVPNAGRLLSAFDVFVLSSRTEGTPMVILEAMAAEVPIIATRVGGVPDVLAAGTALLVSPDSPSELGKAIRAVLTDRGAAMSRARAARRRLDAEYRADVWADRYENIYQHARARAAQRLS